MTMPREYSVPVVRVYGDVAVLTRNVKGFPSCQDKFNASPNIVSADNNSCTSSNLAGLGSH
jgi:hypothetical protein